MRRCTIGYWNSIVLVAASYLPPGTVLWVHLILKAQLIQAYTAVFIVINIPPIVS